MMNFKIKRILEDLAAAVQKLLEEVTLYIKIKVTKKKKFVLFANVILNLRILKK